MHGHEGSSENKFQDHHIDHAGCVSRGLQDQGGIPLPHPQQQVITSSHTFVYLRVLQWPLLTQLRNFIFEENFHVCSFSLNNL